MKSNTKAQYKPVISNVVNGNYTRAQAQLQKIVDQKIVERMKKCANRKLF
jgi:hypothetical protein